MSVCARVRVCSWVRETVYIYVYMYIVECELEQVHSTGNRLSPFQFHYSWYSFNNDIYLYIICHSTQSTYTSFEWILFHCARAFARTLIAFLRSNIRFLPLILPPAFLSPYVLSFHSSQSTEPPILFSFLFYCIFFFMKFLIAEIQWEIVFVIWCWMINAT